MPVMFSTRPPAVTILPSTSAVPAWKISTSSESPVPRRPEITSPEDDDAG
jgi:hypothetical protein